MMPKTLQTIVLTSGYFDPIHVGHIDYLRLSKELGDRLVVIVNTDKQAFLKKGYSFMSQDDRMKIVGSIRYVDEVVLSIDEEECVIKTIKQLYERFKGNRIIFAKGGDRFSHEIPESKVCNDYNIKMVDGLGAKIRSSSEMVKYERRKETM